MTQNPNSLIARILGIFTFEGFETGPISLILMKNISKCPKEAIERIYDIKGSTYDRAVIFKNKNTPNKKNCGQCVNKAS